MITPRKKMDDWFRRQLYYNGRHGDPIQFVLKQIEPGNKTGPEILSIDIPEKKEDRTPDWIEQTINDFINDAESDAMEHPNASSIHYVVQSFFHKRPKTATSRCVFRVEGSSVDEEDEQGHAPTKQGLLGQLMRHTQELTKYNTQATGAMLTSMSRALESASQANEKLLNEKFGNLQVMEDMISQQHDRNLSTMKAEHHQTMMTDLYQKIALIAPHAINKMVGQKVLPEAASTESIMVRNLVESFSPDQLVQIQSVLKPEQMVVFGEIVKTDENKH